MTVCEPVGSKARNLVACLVIVITTYLVLELRSLGGSGRVQYSEDIWVDPDPPSRPNHASKSATDDLKHSTVTTAKVFLSDTPADTPPETVNLSEGETEARMNCPMPKPVSFFSDNDGSTWPKREFCHDFLINTFHDKLPVCGGEVKETDQVKCSGSVYSSHMAQCSYENLAINPGRMKKVIPNDVTWKSPQERTINLLQSPDVSCESPSIAPLSKKDDKDDFQVKLTDHLFSAEKLSPSVCDKWINKTTFFHVSNALHIYFRFMDLYSVHKSLFDYGVNETNHQVIRIGNMGPNYRFPSFDKALFPGALTLDDLPADSTVCFKKVVFSPRSYQSIPFRCKMNPLIRNRCFKCNGKGLTGSPLYSFRSRVLRACNITTTCNQNSHLVIVSRKPYKRWTSDDPKKFQRILKNEDQMVDTIKEAFPSAVVRVAHMEDMDVCEQVQLGVEADVMLGVHGAGLVHFWWLRDEATAIELEPPTQSGNPSFKMLTTLSGRNYDMERVPGSNSGVTVNPDHLLQTIKKHHKVF